jgi:hypothetical protein
MFDNEIFNAGLHHVVAGLPGALLLWIGVWMGRRSRDIEVHGYRLTNRFLENLAVMNAKIADKALAEISKSRKDT